MLFRSPDKDEIINAYAAKDLAPDGTDAGSDPDQILYVGADRYQIDGATDMGFWFIKDPDFGPVPLGNAQSAGFTGHHTEGDILLLSTFTQGGQTTTIRVFKWTGDPQTGSPGEVQAIFGDCVPGAANQNGCATVNDSTISVNWEYVAKVTSTGGWIPAGGMLEAGVNLSDLGLGGCFSSVLAETRSSPELTATLKDFAFGNFEICGANISISPDGVNEVGDPHTFTVNVSGGVSGSESGVEGVFPDVTLSTSDGATIDPEDVTDNCADVGTDADGNCTVVFTSNTVGVVTGHASVTATIEGADFTVETDGANGNSEDAVKRFVDASIAITPDGVNEVGDEHEFTITVTPDAPDGATVSAITITPSVEPAPDSQSDDCAAVTADGPYTCTLTISNDDAGTFTADADVSITFSDGTNSDTVLRSTSGDSGPDGSGSATKRFVDAYITIAEDAVNIVGDPHTFTVNVYQDDGLIAVDENDDPLGDGVAGFGPVADGTIVEVTLTDSDGADNSVSEDTCADPGTVDGECTITFTSPTAGFVTGHAAVSFTLDDVELVRETDGTAPNSDDAVKEFVAGSIRWAKVDNAGELQGGATFDLCLTHSYNLEADLDADPPEDPLVVLAEPDCDSVADNVGALDENDEPTYVGLDEDPDPGEFLVSGLPLGRYSVTETAAPAGFELDPDVKTADLVPGDADADLSGDPFINSRPVLKITGFGYTNEPDGDQPHGILAGTTTYTVTLHNYGTAAAELTDSSLVVSDNADCDGDEGGNTLDLSGATIAVDADSDTYTLTCTYDAPDPAAITATLNVKYTTNGLERTASGSPATIIFTVAAD